MNHWLRWLRLLAVSYLNKNNAAQNNSNKKLWYHRGRRTTTLAASWMAICAISLLAGNGLVQNFRLLYGNTNATDETLQLQPGRHPLSRSTLVMDVGMNNGDDTSLLLELGYNVVAVEANPELVRAGKERFAAEIDQGRLVIVHAALPMGQSTAGKNTKFYVNKDNNEWGSFYKDVGCRGICWNDKQRCNVDKKESCCGGPENCDVFPVSTVNCIDIIKQHGAPFIMKLDIEGAEQNCIDALIMLDKKPRIVTLERNQGSTSVFRKMRELGYTEFKLVEQKRDNGSLGIISGALGALASDCKLGLKWHSIQNYTEAYEKDLVAHCTQSKTKFWYDWQFRHPDLISAGLGLIDSAAAV